MTIARFTPSLILAFGLACLGGPVLAHDDHDPDHEEHGAHVHGLARMNLSVEGDRLTVELESPLANFLPFEHAPETDEHKALAADLIARLRAGQGLSPAPEAACVLQSVTLNADNLGLREGPDTSHEHGHGHHGDLEAVYSYACGNPARLSMVDVEFFQAWPGFERIHVQLVTPESQAALELTPANHAVRW